VARRRGYGRRSRSSIWPWISFIVFGLIIALLVSSVIKNERPDKILADLFSKKEKMKSTDASKLGKKELRNLLSKQDSLIEQLSAELEDCRHDDGFNKAYINTVSESLNLRSEPSLSSDILVKIPNRSRVSIIEWDDVEYYLEGSNGKWCRIKYVEYEGWVWGNYLEIR